MGCQGIPLADNLYQIEEVPFYSQFAECFFSFESWMEVEFLTDASPPSAQMVLTFLSQSISMINFCISGINPTWVFLLHLYRWAVSPHRFCGGLEHQVFMNAIHWWFSFLLFTCQPLVLRLGWPHATRWTVFPLHQFSRRDCVSWVLFLSRILNWPMGIPGLPPFPAAHPPPSSGWKLSGGWRRTAGLSSVQGRTFQQGAAWAASGKWAEPMNPAVLSTAGSTG